MLKFTFLTLFCFCLLSTACKHVNNNPCDNLFIIGNNYFLTGEFAKAEKEFMLSLKEDNMHANAYYGIAIIKQVNSQNNESIKYLDKAIEANPELFLAYYSKGAAYHALGKPIEAIEQFNKAIKIKEDAYFIFYSRAISKFESEDFNGAISDMNIYLKYDSTNAMAYYYKGVFKGEEKDYAGAIADLSNAIQLGFDKPQVYLYRGVYRSNLMQKDLACKDFFTAKANGSKKADDYIETYCQN